MKAADGTLLAGRILMAASFMPAALQRPSNISGFAAALAAKGMPFANGIAAFIVLVELFAPLALAIGIGPRLAAFALLATTAVTTGTLHRFWEMAGAIRQAEQALFMAQLGVMAGLLFFLIAGPGAFSWQTWWQGAADGRKPAAKKKPARARAPRPRPAPVREPDEELADAA